MMKWVALIMLVVGLMHVGATEVAADATPEANQQQQQATESEAEAPRPNPIDNHLKNSAPKVEIPESIPETGFNPANGRVHVASAEAHRGGNRHQKKRGAPQYNVRGEVVGDYASDHPSPTKGRSNAVPQQTPPPPKPEDQEVAGSEAEIKPTEEQLEKMKGLCNSLKDHRSYVSARMETLPEMRLFDNAQNVLAYLHVEAEAEYSKHHHEFTCKEANAVLQHSSVKALMTQLSEIVAGSGADVRPSGVGVLQLAKQVEKLRDDLSEMFLINDHVREDLTDMASVLKELQRLEGSLKKSQTDISNLVGETIKEMEVKCNNAFKQFTTEVTALTIAHLPDWVEINDGLEALQLQCADEDLIRKEEL
jgi:hypothetical protein